MKENLFIKVVIKIRLLMSFSHWAAEPLNDFPWGVIFSPYQGDKWVLHTGIPLGRGGVGRTVAVGLGDMGRMRGVVSDGESGTYCGCSLRVASVQSPTFGTHLPSHTSGVNVLGRQSPERGGCFSIGDRKRRERSGKYISNCPTPVNPFCKSALAIFAHQDLNPGILSRHPVTWPLGHSLSEDICRRHFLLWVKPNWVTCTHTSIARPLQGTAAKTSTCLSHPISHLIRRTMSQSLQMTMNT